MKDWTPMFNPCDPAVKQYQTTGYAISRKVLDPMLTQEADQIVDWILAHNPDIRPENLNSLLTRHEPCLLRLVADSRGLDWLQPFWVQTSPCMGLTFCVSHRLMAKPWPGIRMAATGLWNR